MLESHQTLEVNSMRKWDNVGFDELLNIIEYLKQHFDSNLSRKVIELFHERMRDDEHVDPDVLYAFMKHAFALIMEGKTADQALGLKQVRGRYNRADTVDRDIQAAAIVILKLRSGCKWLDAVADTSLHLNISESTVQRACDEYRDALELLPDATLKQTTDIPDISTNSP